MKRYYLAVLAVLMALTTTAAVKAPDFAFPRTVSKEAAAAYKTAVKNNDENAMLDAAIRIYLAGISIDNSSSTKCIGEFISNIAPLKKPASKAMATLFEASAYSYAYNQERYKFDGRELPLTPRPTDMAEWSGEMYKFVIDSLISESFRLADNTPLAQFKPIITADELSLSFYPSVKDFVSQYATGTLKYYVPQKTVDAVIDQMKVFHQSRTNPWYLWQTIAIEVNSDIDTSAKVKQYMALYQSQPQETGRAFVLERIIDDISEVRPKASQQVSFLDSALTYFKGYWIENNLRNEINRLKNPAIEISSPKSSFPADSETIKLKVSYSNLSHATVRIYNFTDENVANKAVIYGLGASRPVKSIALDFGQATPDERDTTITVSLPVGCNAIVSDIASTDSKKPYPLFINALKLVPTIVSEGNRRTLYITDAISGAPVQDVAAAVVSRRKNTKVTKLGTSDKLGRIIFECPEEGILQLKYNGLTSTYNNVSFYRIGRNDFVPTNISMTTDLPVYKLGQEVRCLGVLADTTGAVSNSAIQLTLRDSNYKTIGTNTAYTDGFGRFTCKFSLPSETRTGRFSISAQGTNHASAAVGFEVSDFKMPAFRADSIAVVGAGLHKDYADASGRILTYAGFPLSNTRIDICVSGVDSTFTTTTNADGRFALRLDSVFSDKANNRWRNVSISATSPDGTKLDVYNSSVSRYPYNLELSGTGRKFDSDSIITVKAKLTTALDREIDGTLRWRLCDKKDTTICAGIGKTGSLTLDFSKIKPGEYTLKVCDTDSLASATSVNITLYSLHSDSLPKEGILWTPDSKVKVHKGEITARVLVSAPGANIFYGILDRPEDYKCEYVKAGWHTLHYKADADGEDNFVAFAVRDIAHSSLNFEIEVQNIDKEALKLVLESFRDKVYTGSTEKWQFRITDAQNRPVEAALALNVYNSRLSVFGIPDALRPACPSLFNPGVSIRFPEQGWQASFYRTGIFTTLRTTSPVAPLWNTYNSEVDFSSDDIRLLGYINVAYGVSLKSAKQSARPRNMAMAKKQEFAAEEDAVEESAPMYAAVAETSDEAKESADGMDGGDKQPLLRTPDIFSAMWQPTLTSDRTGCLDIDFLVPDALTTWQLTATAWDKKMNTASLTRTLTASKPVMVSANMPRFLRAGDRARVLATAMNGTDSILSVSVITEAFALDNDSVISSATKEMTLAPGAKDLIATDINVPLYMQGEQLGFRVRAVAGNFGDGEQIAIPVLDAESFVREAINFYLNPTDSVYTTALPQPVGRDFKSEFSFTANPMATIIDALPVLWKDPAPTAFSQASAYYGAAIALAMAEKYPEIAAKFDSKQLRRLSDEALKRLIKLQRADGGFAWGEWSSESSYWITTAILDRFYDLTRWGYLPKDKSLAKALDAAIRYCDSRVRDTDLTYTIIRPVFTSVRPSLNAQQVIDRTLNNITRNWKKYSTDAKALSVLALANNKRLATARSIISSLDQYAVTTPSKGTVFKNERSLLSYGHLLEAYAAAAPRSTIVDGLRQYLIVRRQATDWGNWNLTSYVVSSFLNSGTEWAEPKVSPELYVDNATVVLSQPKGDAMVYSAPVSGKELRLDVHDAGVPSYGAIVSSYVAPMDKIKAYSESDEVSISKRLLVRDASGKMHDAPAVLSVGQTLTVSVTIRTTRPMSYVSISDCRPAAFEPADQLSHAVWQDALFYYRENRDAETRIFIDYLPEGTNVISYDVTVNNAGEFASGIATITCDKAPSLTAHTAGATITVNND